MVGSSQVSLVHQMKPGYGAEIKSYYVITRDTLACKSIDDHLTRMATVDEIINLNASRAPWKGKN